LPGQESSVEVGSGSHSFEIPYEALQWPVPALGGPFDS
jgi:hypothetical protein